MKKNAMLWLLFTVLLLTSRSGSVEPPVREPSVAIRAPKLKLTRTQGSNPMASQVRCVLQDKAGDLWFGTTGEGVYRYDGKGFSQYTIQDGLNSNIVWSILEDKNGIIWFGTDSGLCRWDGKSIRSVPLSSVSGVFAEPTFTRPVEPAVWSMLEDKKGTIWIGTAEGMLCSEDGVISSFLNKARIQNPSFGGELHLKMVDDILEDRQGNIWFASGMPPGMEGLCRFDRTSITRFNPGGEKWIRSLVEDPRGVLWLGTRHQGVWRYDGKTFSPYTEHLGLGWPMLVDRSGNIWFSGDEWENQNTTGIWRYDVGASTFRNFTTKDGVGEFGVWCGFEDRDGNIWVGTRNTGLYRYDGKSFTCFSE